MVVYSQVAPIASVSNIVSTQTGANTVDVH